jgi:hypothetical protein
MNSEYSKTLNISSMRRYVHGAGVSKLRLTATGTTPNNASVARRGAVRLVQTATVVRIVDVCLIGIAWADRGVRSATPRGRIASHGKPATSANVDWKNKHGIGS